MCTRRGARRQYHDYGPGSSHSRIATCEVSRSHYGVLTIATIVLPNDQSCSFRGLGHNRSSQDTQNGQRCNTGEAHRCCSGERRELRRRG